MTVPSLQAFIARHSASAAGLAALAAALDARATGRPLEPALAAKIHALLEALEAGDLLAGLRPEEAGGLAGFVRTVLAIDRKLLADHTRTQSWDFTDPELLNGVGMVARSHALEITREIVPALHGLGDRLRAPGAAFLDVGAGVAGLAIAFAQMWPEARVVGIDPWKPSLALARVNVDDANLPDRIELREQGGEALEDQAAFDLAWIAFPFIPERLVAPVCDRVLRSLKPGGWAIVGMSGHASMDPVMSKAMGLRMHLCGGADWSTDRTEVLLREQGYVDVRTLPSVPGSVLVNVVGRRVST
jgi:SAM-dependent methyltransferase